MFLKLLVLAGIVTLATCDEVDLLGVCDPHKDICVAKYASCEPFLGNVNGEKYAMVEAKAGLLEVNANSRRCTCLPGFSAVNIGKAVGDAVRLECVPVEGASCYTDGDCNIRNLDCLPLLSLIPGIFGAANQLGSDTIFPPGFLTAATQQVYAFIAGFLQLSTQFLCGFNRVNTIEYKCTYSSPTKQDTYMYGGGFGNPHGGASSPTTNGFGGQCQRVNRNDGYPSASSLSKGISAHPAPHPQPRAQPQPQPQPYYNPYGTQAGYQPYGGAAYGNNPYGNNPYGATAANPYGATAYGNPAGAYGSPVGYGAYNGKKR